jgi:hypothetical protein
MMATQDVAHRQLVNAMAQVRQRPLDASIAPRWILHRHANDKLLDFIGDARSAPRWALMAAIELLRNELPIPAQEGLGRYQGGKFLQTLATERVGEGREAPAFRVREAQAAPTKLGFEDAVFLVQIGDHLLLVPLEPPGDHGNQEVQDHTCSSVWKP